MYLDVHRPDGASRVPVVVLWHGVGPRERDVMAPLAGAVARFGVVVVTPDWDASAHDGGRTELWQSLAYVREHGSGFGGNGRVTLAGWSRGARAAAGIVMRPDLTPGWRPHAWIGIAASYDLPAPTTGTVPVQDLAVRARADAIPGALVTGTADPVVAPDSSRRFARALDASGWKVPHIELETDHAGLILCEFDPARKRCIPATRPNSLAAGQVTATIIARAALGVP